MEPNEIWGLIIKADEKVKYATDARGAQRAEQAVALLREALAESTAIGNTQLAEQATKRLADLGASEGEPDA